MGRRSAKVADNIPAREFPPARNAEERENQLISLATDLAEKQLREGTASSQVITHYLKLGTMREKLELRNKELDNELLIAKREALESAKHVEELYAEAITAMRSYSGADDEML